MKSFTDVWLNLLDAVLYRGIVTAPRGQLTKELCQHTITVDMQRPVLRSPTRKLNYQFMAAEAFWILSGDDRVETIKPYNSRIAEFSDDGERFFGAYGPKILAQLPYVVAKLQDDPDTRQAGLTIWRENPPITKDYPCTIAIWFSIRQRQLNCQVFMRSSDVWLGIPYDVFNFSMLAHLICAHLNQRVASMIAPGILSLTAASSHLYDRNRDEALACLTAAETVDGQSNTPRTLWLDPTYLLNYLESLRDTKPGDPHRWWE